MAAAVFQCRGLTVRAEKQHDVLAEQTKRLRTILEIVERNDRVPEPAQDFLLRRQHPVSSERIVFVGYQASLSTTLSCHAPSASFDRPTITRNRAMPAAVIRNSAANMRGISSW